ncbi:MAG: formate--tetrahydrofolate ligase [Alphaproteobacteria bacterium]|nr:formate--tetrahydrofolate ligase [Alphaproteobacteria bacterium]MCL2505920.1 formate--tetrahydrofolate ligase [Alphaproteobacteria bacterium]
MTSKNTAGKNNQHVSPKTDIEISQLAALMPVTDIAEKKLGIPKDNIYSYGPHKAKISLEYLKSIEKRPNAKMILVTAITPTPAGEGKTTTTIGLNDALNHIGKKSVICLREPSLGPCFGQKGGATGGGYAQVAPMEDINLHFTGDFHAIGTANNLLASIIDNHIFWGNPLNIDARRIAFRRAMDLNDRALRSIVQSLGGAGNGYPREDGFDITVATEVMAIFCLAKDMEDLKRRLGNIIIGQDKNKRFVRASELKCIGAMAALLKDAVMPNLVQTLENNPAIVHGGPFANIAHGCNSVIATKASLKLADYVVTEAGFGADLGAEKFFDIKCRSAGLKPDCTVLVATIRALKMHGGVAKEELKHENLKALESGFANLKRHISNMKKYGVPVVVSINRFSSDTEAEMELLRKLTAKEGVSCMLADHWGSGGEGAVQLAEEVVKTIETKPSKFAPLYKDNIPLAEKIRTIATEIYGAKDIALSAATEKKLKEFEAEGFGKFPICIAKTQYSFSTDASRKGAPEGHIIAVRDVKVSAGAEFIVALCGDILTMPGLPKEPAANNIYVDDEGKIKGLF